LKTRSTPHAIEVFHEALDNIKAHPSKCVRAAVGGATGIVPVEVAPGVGEALADSAWLIKASRARMRTRLEERLAGELMEPVQSRGTAVKKAQWIRTKWQTAEQSVQPLPW